jgi:hypothetical protein
LIFIRWKWLMSALRFVCYSCSNRLPYAGNASMLACVIFIDGMMGSS